MEESLGMGPSRSSFTQTPRREGLKERLLNALRRRLRWGGAASRNNGLSALGASSASDSIPKSPSASKDSDTDATKEEIDSRPTLETSTATINGKEEHVVIVGGRRYYLANKGALGFGAVGSVHELTLDESDGAPADSNVPKTLVLKKARQAELKESIAKEFASRALLGDSPHLIKHYGTVAWGHTGSGGTDTPVTNAIVMERGTYTLDHVYDKLSQFRQRREKAQPANATGGTEDLTTQQHPTEPTDDSRTAESVAADGAGTEQQWRERIRQAERHESLNEKITEREYQEVVRYLQRGIQQGLGHMRSIGRVHYDLKPENVMLNESFEVKLIDIGGEKEGESYGMAFTPGYQSPEAEGARLASDSDAEDAAATHKNDVYAAGVMLGQLQHFRMLTNRQLPAWGKRNIAYDPREGVPEERRFAQGYNPSFPNPHFYRYHPEASSSAEASGAAQTEDGVKPDRFVANSGALHEYMQNLTASRPEDRFSADQALGHRYLSDEATANEQKWVDDRRAKGISGTASDASMDDEDAKRILRAVMTGDIKTMREEPRRRIEAIGAPLGLREEGRAAKLYGGNSWSAVHEELREKVAKRSLWRSGLEHSGVTTHL